MNTILEQINSAGFVFVKFALSMLAQSSVLIVVLLLADLLLRKKVRAVFRYWLWMLVLLKLILPTTLSSPVSLGSWFGDELAAVILSETSTSAEPVGSPQIEQVLPTEEASTPSAVTLTPGAEPVVVEATGSPVVSPTPLTWQGIVFLVWAAIVAAMGLLLLQRAIFVRGLVAQAKNPTQLMNDAFRFCCGQMGLKGKVGLKVSANTTSPAVCGLFRPVILLPQNLAPTLGSSRLRPVLLHELAHIKRGDLWINLAQTILQIIYFYNPLLWLANSVIRRIREQAVDEAVQVAMGASAHQYPQTLVDVAKMAFSSPALSLRLIGVVESKSALKGRIKRLLNRPIPKTAKLGVTGILAVFIIGAVLLPMARAEKYTSAEKTFQETLNEEQKLYMEWTQEQFGFYLDKSEYIELSESTKKELAEKWIEILKGAECEKYYDAINGLAAIKSKRAVEPLLKIAAERAEKDNRYRWQAVRALGIVGDDSVVPELIHLVYHYNQNTRFWAQISLVRLTGKNFGTHWQKWAHWWNSQKGKPRCSTKKVEWTSNADWAKPKKQKEMDEKFIEHLRENKKEEADKSVDRAGQGPIVVRTSPTVYADDVSPKLREITVTFDQPMMDKSWSWVQWDAPYPETVGSPYYDDEKKTCTLPVKLESAKAYLVAFNLEPYTGFRNAAGEPAKPYVLVFATKGEDGKPTPIPEELITKAKSINEHAEEIRPGETSGAEGVPYTQIMFNDIQPDGAILFKTTVRQINRSGKEITNISFINSDFVHVTGMSDAEGRPLEFTSTHEGDVYLYKVTFNKPVGPGEVIEYRHEGRLTGLIHKVPGTQQEYKYHFRHWPQAGQPTRRVETYLLPAGAELISTTPEDMQRRTKDGRIELHVEKTIPSDGSITTAFQYRLTDIEKTVEQAVMTISTCSESDPRVGQSLESLQVLDEQAVVKEIVKFLDSDENTVRRSAIYILWKGDFKSIEPAVPGLQKLCSHKEDLTRGMAAISLGAAKVDSSFDVLCNMTLNDSSAYARRCAAYALGLMGNPKAKDVLEKAMKDSDFNVRNNAEAALKMLLQIEKPKSTQPETEIKDRGSSTRDAKTPAEQNQLNEAVYKQLNEIVDLSELNPEMPFSEAIEMFKNSVDPPLKMFVNWRDLYDNADIDQATPINMDAIPAVRLSQALKLVLKAVSGDLAELDYVVEDGIIFIATIESLPRKFETSVYDISGIVGSAADADDIAQLVEYTVEPYSWEGVGGEGTIAVYHDKKLIVYQTHEIHKQIQDLLQGLQASSHEQEKSETEVK